MAAAKTRLSAANPAVTNRFVASTNMIVGAYSLAQTTMPTPGVRRLTVTHTTATGADTLGTLTVVGTDLRGQPLTEVITPVAASTVTGSKFFKTVASITGADWVINGGNDTIVVGCEAGDVVSDAPGHLDQVIVGLTAAGTITLADAAGIFAVLKSSIPEGAYRFDVDYAGFLRVTLGAASDVTVTHSLQAASYAP